ncbi:MULTISPECIES: NAD(P)H-binding protein [unclassified Rhizobium]|uniref:NmrA family NAD(P)-binding protein n=1 Tax=unclassified Rhizobium TaxID=2613769 RepID=UPI000EAA3C36|nr:MULTISPECIES: NAD(P)H-binding protein [unclassified Rhizobium]AYG68548.1 hydroxylase [Rhizobium sp. CCGE531]AYG74932.1 hydroxylase [Rhizobium sp. CCGE532]
MNEVKYELPILVTGAAGRIGSVGRMVTELLLARGFRVRAQVRVDDERAAVLRDLGADVIVGDLLDLTAVHRAIQGCERLCFAMSVSPSYLEAAANVAVVAKHHGVKAFVNLSQMTVKEMDIFTTTASPQQKQHWLAEQILSWSGLPVVEVRPTAFMEGLFLQAAKAIASQDKIMAPFGKGKNSAIAAADVARVIAEILSDPTGHIGKTYHLTGPVSQDMNAIAREFSAALGRMISYVDVPLEVMKGQLAAFGMPPHVVLHVATMAQLHQDNRYDRFSADVERLTGVPPMSVGEFVQQNAQAFAPVAPSSAVE